MKEDDYFYNKRMQEARHYLTTGGENRYSRGLSIFFLWGKFNKPNPNDKNWDKFVREAKK